MAEKVCNHALEKCLDCWNYRKIRGHWRCLFGLIPATIRAKVDEKSDQTKLMYVCYGYFDVKGKEAPAKKALLKRIRKFKGEIHDVL